MDKLQSAIGATYLELKESLREDTVGQNHAARCTLWEVVHPSQWTKS